MHWIDVSCPFCWQAQTIPVEADLAGSQVIDCQVCCRPWQIDISWPAGAAEPSIHVERA